MEDELAPLQARLGYQFKDPELLRRAITHKSHAFESNSEPEARDLDNEQMEFLGDSILGFLVSEILVKRSPDAVEGDLSKWKAYLVSACHLHDVAQSLDLGAYLRLGRGEEMSGGRNKRALLSDALEAVLAAMYLDGGIEPVRRLVIEEIAGDFDAGRTGPEVLVVDYKSALQEAAQSLGHPLPRYVVVRETGPEHQKTFTVEARLGPELTERADGSSKKAAGQAAARRLLAQLQTRADRDSESGI